MPIIQEKITVPISNRNFQYYKSLGYNIHKDTKITVPIKDLPKKSDIKILVKCNNCRKKYLKVFNTIKNFDYILCKYCNDHFNEDRKNKLKKYSGKNCFWYGKKHSEKTKFKMSQNCIGENNPNYNFKLTSEDRLRYRKYTNGYYYWQQSVLKRDNYTCQKCKHKGKYKDNFMSVHHINNFSQFEKQRTDLQNGITLCKDCHKLIHHIYGKYTIREHLNQFMKVLQN